MYDECFLLLLNFSDPKHLVRPRISLADCLEAWSQTELIDGFYSTAVNATCTAKK